MLYYYAVKNLIDYLLSHPQADFADMCRDLKGKRVSSWVNFGGQLMPEFEADRLRADIGNGLSAHRAQSSPISAAAQRRL